MKSMDSRPGGDETDESRTAAKQTSTVVVELRIREDPALKSQPGDRIS
jgi:hypothetical protein